MNIDANGVADLVQSELGRVSEAKVLRLLAKYGVALRMESRPWGYADKVFPCWIVFEHRASNTGVAYCEEGFGPKKPWGLLWLNGDYPYMGDDTQWFARLGDAVRDTFAYSDE